jgi:hypothetical protein
MFWTPGALSPTRGSFVNHHPVTLCVVTLSLSKCERNGHSRDRVVRRKLIGIPVISCQHTGTLHIGLQSITDLSMNYLFDGVPK